MPPFDVHPRFILRVAFAASRPQNAYACRCNRIRAARFSSNVSKPPDPPSSNETPKEKHSSVVAISNSLRTTDAENNNLLSPVNIPEDLDGVLNQSHPAADLLSHSSLVVTRQVEMMNIMIGFEQANRYVVMDPQGNHVGYIAERDLGMGNAMARQAFRTHRSFITHVFNKHQREVLRFHRPFAWISSRIGVYDPLEEASVSHSDSTALQKSQPGALSSDIAMESANVSSLGLKDMRIIGEAQQQWAPLRRKYNLFLFRKSTSEDTQMDAKQLSSGDLPLSNSHQRQVSQQSRGDSIREGDFGQFAYVDEPFLSWDFSLLSATHGLIGSVNRNWSGFGRELFTDTGVYMLQSGDAATAVSVDFDYFSRKSGSGGFMPMWFPWGSGGAEAGAEAGAAGDAGAAGVSEAGLGEATDGAVGKVGKGTAGMAEGGTAGVVGYEAMQRGVHDQGDDASPMSSDYSENRADPTSSGPPQADGNPPQGEDVWGQSSDPWADSGSSTGSGGAGGESEGGSGLWQVISSFFSD